MMGDERRKDRSYYTEQKSLEDRRFKASQEANGVKPQLDDVQAELEKHKKSTDMLKNIEAWLCFNSSPDDLSIYTLKRDIQKHLSEYVI